MSYALIKTYATTDDEDESDILACEPSSTVFVTEDLTMATIGLLSEWRGEVYAVWEGPDAQERAGGESPDAMYMFSVYGEPMKLDPVHLSNVVI